MFTFSDIPAGSKNDSRAYRQQLIDRGYTFEAYGDIETFQRDHADVWEEVRDQMLAGKIVWDSERGGYWQAPNTPTMGDAWTAVVGAVGIGLVYAAIRMWTAPKK